MTLIRTLFAVGLCFACAALRAGPPYLTDDPEPVELHHWEAFLFATGQTIDGVRSGLAPAAEVNYGLFPEAQIQFQVPVAFGPGPDGRHHQGLGDLQLGFKYRFLQESDGLPQLAVYPQIQAPTGPSAEGLGSGHWRVFLPVWLQKQLGAWTTYGGGGWWRNPGPDNRNYTVWGWQIQRELGEGYSIGAEVFHQGAPSFGLRATTTWNLGFECALTPRLQLVGSGGRLFQGGQGRQFYLGLRGKT